MARVVVPSFGAGEVQEQDGEQEEEQEAEGAGSKRSCSLWFEPGPSRPPWACFEAMLPGGRPAAAPQAAGKRMAVINYLPNSQVQRENRE